MWHPFRITKEWFTMRGEKGVRAAFISGSNLHPNPKLYKYYWWIYPANSTYASAYEVFYKPEHALTMKEFDTLSKRLFDENISFAYVNRKVHRLGNKIWDYEKIKQEYPNTEFAPAFDDDPDEEHEGHK